MRPRWRLGVERGIPALAESGPAVTSRIRIGDLLVRAGAISSTQLNAALSEQRRWGGRLGSILVKMQFVSEGLLVRALSKQLGVGVANLSQLAVPKMVRKRLDPEQLRAARVCPVTVDSDARTLNLAMADPTDLRAMDEVRFRTGYRVVVQLGGEEEIERAIGRLYGQSDYPEVELDLDPSGTPNLVPPRESLSFEAGGGAAGPYASGSADLVPEVASSPAGPYDSGAIDTGSIRSGAAGSDELREHQVRHERALRVMVDLLIERGVFTREEYLAMLSQQE